MTPLKVPYVAGLRTKFELYSFATAQVRFADSGGNAADRGQTNAENKLFVGGVPVGCGDKELRSLFSNYGEVQDVYILASKSSQEGQRGCAFVRYAAPQVRSASSI